MFGLFVGKGYETAEADAGDVHIRAVFTAAGRPCAELLLKTAVDVINFYRQQFGFYPQQSLSIVPGMDYPAGGYPPATALAVIHGQERLSERPADFWRWITAHEIGHQYWSEYVLSKEPDGLGWLMIGLGIYADREYSRARGITDQHPKFFAEYIEGVRQGLDTTAELTPEQSQAIGFDFNNIVVHGKGFSIISALAAVLGRETFDRIYARTLKEYGGRRLATTEFQSIAERETGQNLDWFFDQWARSNRFASYRVASQDCRKEGPGYLCTVQVERAGTLSMPVPLAAVFEDGTRQMAFTDRLMASQTLTFRAAKPLKEARLDPDGEIALVIPPPDPAYKASLATRIRYLGWTKNGGEPLELFHAAQSAQLGAFEWFKLGLTLYDSHYYPESLEAFRKASGFGFAAFVWQGHVLDLLGRRGEAIEAYRKALEVGGPSPSMQHSQYDMTIDRAWIEERLKTPFTRSTR